MELFPLIASPFLTLNDFFFQFLLSAWWHLTHYQTIMISSIRLTVACNFPHKMVPTMISYLVDATTLGIWRTSMGCTLPIKIIYQWMDILFKNYLFYCTLKRVQGGPYRSTDNYP